MTILSASGWRGFLSLGTVQLVHGARSVINWIGRKKEKTQQDLWVVSLVERRGKNCATVALANKIGRIIWAVLRTSKPYRPHSLSIMAS